VEPPSLPQLSIDSEPLFSQLFNSFTNTAGSTVRQKGKSHARVRTNSGCFFLGNK
jgi:hypothetical protein